jgi:hypothetical protein
VRLQFIGRAGRARGTAEGLYGRRWVFKYHQWRRLPERIMGGGRNGKIHAPLMGETNGRAGFTALGLGLALLGVEVCSGSWLGRSARRVPGSAQSRRARSGGAEVSRPELSRG